MKMLLSYLSLTIIILLVSCGGHPGVDEVFMPAEVVSFQEFEDDTFITIVEPEKILDGFYRVVVKRSNGELYSVPMSVYVEPGTEVELYDLRYYQNRGNSKLILIAKPKKNPSSQPSL